MVFRIIVLFSLAVGLLFCDLFLAMIFLASDLAIAILPQLLGGMLYFTVGVSGCIWLSFRISSEKFWTFYGIFVIVFALPVLFLLLYGIMATGIGD